MAEQRQRPPQECTTPKFRANHVKLIKAESFKQGKPKFGLSMIFDKKTDLSAIKKAAQAAMVKAFGEDKSKWPKLGNPLFRDGDTHPKCVGKAHFKNTFVLKASTGEQYPPTLLAPDKTQFQTEEEKKAIYSGCYAKASIKAAYYEGFGGGVNFYLKGVQKIGDGQKLGGDASGDFEVEQDESEDMSNYQTEDETDPAFM